MQVASLEGKVQGLNAFCEVLQQGSCNCEARSVVASGKSEEYLPMTPVDKAEDGPYVEVGGTSAIPRVKPPVSSSNFLLISSIHSQECSANRSHESPSQSGPCCGVATQEIANEDVEVRELRNSRGRPKLSVRTWFKSKENTP